MGGTTQEPEGLGEHEVREKVTKESKTTGRRARRGWKQEENKSEMETRPVHLEI